MKLAVASAAVTLGCLLLTACAAPSIQATGPAAGAPVAVTVAAVAVWPPTATPVRPPRPFTTALDMPDLRDLAWQASGAP